MRKRERGKEKVHLVGTFDRGCAAHPNLVTFEVGGDERDDLLEIDPVEN